MSVPAHAPYDWIALVETGESIDPITIIDVEELGSNPARRICEELNIKSQKEKEKLDKATEIVYKKEFHTGVLNDKCFEYAGVKISDIKDKVKNDLISKGLAVSFKEFSEEVVCRCGEKVVIKRIPDQWFIKYSDTVLTNDTKKHVNMMNIYPEEYKEELPRVLDWFDDRACIRKGSWLGTEFPFKKGWVIEPISDSTLYPAYYVISKYVNENKLKPEDMTEEFFDYVFLGRGKSRGRLWDVVKKDFDFWYPVDINLGGKEHKTVHFPVFLMNHVAVMPRDKWPQGIFVHWWVTQKGKEKISKSKGGAEHVEEAATRYGVDTMRLYYSHVGSPFVDVEWDHETVLKYKNKIENIYRFIVNLFDKKLSDKKNTHIDQWLISSLNKKIKKVRDAFEKYDLRVVSTIVFFECQKDLQWYIKRGGGNKELIKEFINSWIKMMSPITPHLSEELWHINNIGFVTNEPYPQYDPGKIFEEAENKEKLLSGLIDDINEITRVTEIKPKKIIVYTAPLWKWRVYRKAIELDSEKQFNIKNIMKEVMADPEMRRLGQEVAKFTGKLAEKIKKLGEKDKKRYLKVIDEKKYLENSQGFLEKTFSCKFEIKKADEKELYDPKNKSKFADPLKPAIYIE